MSKQLRLDVAQLTDVGRKRPHNEDNMAHIIPKDAQVMARKGALFIVADGMGGHAAGEVASEIAVDTVSYVYYQDDNDDITASLMNAIRRANALIHQRAAENMMRSGMGTTCVAAVLRANMAYIANVGDSRAYLVRRGQVKQISQDHSWVEEQVRAGLLTRDQARSHAQRNVITRCLGTQVDVEVDVFVEPLEEGDSIILCTDGLSGLIGEDDLKVIVDQYLPKESVYHLVERANENGGSDNITAIVMRVQEVGWEPPPSRRPVRVGGREVGEDTAVLGRLPGSVMGLPARMEDGRVPSSPLRVASGPLFSAENIAMPQPVVMRSKPGRNRLFYPTLAIFVVLIVALISGGLYYFFLRPPSVDVDGSLAQASTLISQANSGVTTHPIDAIQKLAKAQQLLRTVQGVSSLSDTQKATFSNLQNGFVSTTRTALSNYNQNESIMVLPCTTTRTSPINNGSTNTQAKDIATIQDGKGNSFSYVLGGDQNLYQLSPDQHSLINAHAFPNAAKALLLTSDSQRLYALTVPAQQGNTASYTLDVLTPDQTGALKDTTTGIDAKLLAGGTPTLMTASGADAYLVLTSPATANEAMILDYNTGNLTQAPQNKTIEISTAIISTAAFPNHQLFLLHRDGSIQSYLFGNTPESVFVQRPVATPLAVSPSAVSLNTLLVTPVSQPSPVAQNSSFALSIPGGIFLIAGSVNGVSHLYAADTPNHRILDLTVAPATSNTGTPAAKVGAPAATSPASTSTSSATTGGGTAGGPSMTMQLQHQYFSTTMFASVRSMVVDSKKMELDLLTQTTQKSPTLNLVAFDVTGATCTPAS